MDIAPKLINFSGLKSGKDVEIVLTGLRPGEKLHEELYWQGEGIVPTENKKITMLKPNGLYPDRLYTQLKKLEESSHLSNIQGIYTLLKEIVPETKIGNGV